MEQVCDSKKKKPRTSWRDLNRTKTFLETCIDEVVQNGREGAGTLKQESWKKVIEEMKKTHNVEMDQKCVKNRFDFLKIKYAAFVKLKNKTGNRYDPSTNSFNYTDEEWKIEMQGDKAIEGLKSVPLPFPDMCMHLFEKTISRGVIQHGPSMDLEEEPEVVVTSNVNETPTSTPTSAPASSSRFEGQTSRKRKKVPKNTEDLEMDDMMKKAMTQIIKATSGPSVDECKDKLIRLGWGNQNKNYMWALAIFCENSAYRTTWIGLEDEDCEEFVQVVGSKLGLK